MVGFLNGLICHLVYIFVVGLGEKPLKLSGFIMQPPQRNSIIWNMAIEHLQEQENLKKKKKVR